MVIAKYLIIFFSNLRISIWGIMWLDKKDFYGCFILFLRLWFGPLKWKKRQS